MFSIVAFLADQSLEVMPSTWLIQDRNDTYCFWPPKTSNYQINKLVKDNSPFDKSWPVYCCNVLVTGKSYKEMDKKICEMLTQTDSSELGYLTLSVERRSKKRRMDVNNDSSIDMIEQTPASSFDATLPVGATQATVKKVQGANTTATSLTSADTPKTAYLETLIKQNESTLQLLLTKQQELFDTKVDHFGKLYSLLLQVLSENQSLKDDLNRLHQLIPYNISAAQQIVPLSVASAPTPDIVSTLPKLPITCLEDLFLLDGMIIKNVAQRSLLVYRLAKLGGPKPATVIHTMMKYLITKEVAMQFSLRGRHQKRAFADLQLHRCVIEASQKTEMTARFSEYEVNLVIGAHLAGASDRGGGRTARFLRSSEAKSRLRLTSTPSSSQTPLVLETPRCTSNRVRLVSINANPGTSTDSAS